MKTLGQLLLLVFAFGLLSMASSCSSSKKSYRPASYSKKKALPKKKFIYSLSDNSYKDKPVSKNYIVKKRK